MWSNSYNYVKEQYSQKENTPWKPGKLHFAINELHQTQTHWTMKKWTEPCFSLCYNWLEFSQMSRGLLHADSWPYGPEKPPWICIISQEMVVHREVHVDPSFLPNFLLGLVLSCTCCPSSSPMAKTLEHTWLVSSPCLSHPVTFSSHLFYRLAPRDHHWPKITLHSPMPAAPLPWQTGVCSGSEPW